jgi:vacuolar-type H+-ATPase subunit E/Vma4
MAAKQSEALAPVHEALLAAARAQAGELLARAQQSAGEAVRRAQAQAEEIRAQARARGAADAADLVAAARSRAARQARAVVLAAVRAEYEALRQAARQAVAALTDDPDYQFVRQRMTVSLRRLLGAEAHVRDAAGGGVVATVPGRSADLSLARLADRAVETVLAEESQLQPAARVGVA